MTRMTLDSANRLPDYRSVFEAIPGLLIIVAPDLTILAVNDSFCHASMTQREDIIGRHVFEVFPDNPDDPQATGVNDVRSSFERVLLVGRPDAIVAQKFAIRRPESEGGGFEERYWNLLNSPVFDADGQVICIVDSVEDVTQLVRLDAESEARGRLAQEQQSVIDHLRAANRRLAHTIEENKHLEAERLEAIGAHRRASDVLNKTIESMADAVLVADTSGNIIHSNPAAARLFGSPADITELKNLNRLYNPDGETIIADGEGPLALALRGQSTHNFEFMRRLAGVEDDRHFTASSQPIWNPDGTIEGAVAVYHDITAMRSSEEKSEERFRRVVESAPSAMVMIDASGRIEMVNAQAERVFGYPRSELLGQSVEMLVPERFRARHPGLRNSFFAEPRSMGAGRELFGLRKDGKEFPVEIGLNPIDTEEGAMVLSSIVDISARKRLEEHFQRVVESAPNAMVMINGSGRIEMVNAQAERVFGYSRTELLGQLVEMLVPARFRNQHPGLRNSFLRDPRSRPMGAGRDLYGRRKDGSEFPVEIGLNPIETEEGTMVLSAIVDISDRTQREERVQAALKEKDILLSEIHHRVKNNLQVIHSLLELQSSKIDDRTAWLLLKESQNRIRSMALIHQALYESNGFVGVDFGSFLDTLVPNLVSSYSVDPGRVSLLINSAEVSLPISTAVPCGLIVNELISNALKHGFPDGRTGHINIDLSKAQDEVVLSVSDDGVGFKPELNLADATTLGLQLVSLLADQLGGRISMQRSNPTRFELRFQVQP